MPTFTLPIQYLDTLQRIGKACDTDKTSPMLSGIRIFIQGDKIETAATDGKILAQHVGDIENPTGACCDIILPWATDKPMQSWIKSNAKGHGPVIILVENRQITLQANGETTLRKIVDATFPNYRAALNNEKPFTHGFTGGYLATMNDILCGKGVSCVKVQQGRGWIFERLSSSESIRVLIMPVTMPDQKTWVQVESSEYMKLLQAAAELRKMKGEA